MERLTPGEEKVMLKLWKLEKATVKDLLELFPNPKPAYNTVSTIIRILEKKKFVRHKEVGRGHVYLPKISHVAYRDYLAGELLENYFLGDRNELISFFNSQKSLDDIL